MTKNMKPTSFLYQTLLAFLLLLFALPVIAQIQPSVRGAPVDPGPRAGAAAAGQPLSGLTSAELAAFNSGLEAFNEVDAVSNGLGPRFNLDSCAGCHAHPAVGGSSPPVNPQIAVASKNGAHNQIPSF